LDHLVLFATLLDLYCLVCLLRSGHQRQVARARGSQKVDLSSYFDLDPFYQFSVVMLLLLVKVIKDLLVPGDHFLLLLGDSSLLQVLSLVCVKLLLQILDGGFILGIEACALVSHLLVEGSDGLLNLRGNLDTLVNKVLLLRLICAYRQLGRPLLSKQRH
jgi:hypothetical protein